MESEKVISQNKQGIQKATFRTQLVIVLIIIGSLWTLKDKKFFFETKQALREQLCYQPTLTQMKQMSEKLKASYQELMNEVN